MVCRVLRVLEDHLHAGHRIGSSGMQTGPFGSAKRPMRVPHGPSTPQEEILHLKQEDRDTYLLRGKLGWGWWWWWGVCVWGGGRLGSRGQRRARGQSSHGGPPPGKLEGWGLPWKLQSLVGRRLQLAGESAVEKWRVGAAASLPPAVPHPPCRTALASPLLQEDLGAALKLLSDQGAQYDQNYYLCPIVGFAPDRY